MTVFSNGSLRTSQWWTRLARLLNRPQDKVVFSIDGLKDTNALYRINSSWNKILENVKAFIGAGGRARWDWLKFDHNAHQTAQARQLSQKLGFFQFNVKNTARFVVDRNYKTRKKVNSVQTRYGRLNSTKNPNTRRFESVVKKYGSWQNYIDQTLIECKAKALKSVYMDFEGNVWPCCWLGAPRYFVMPNTQREQLEKLYETYGADFNNLQNKSLAEILDHEWLREKLVESWSNSQSDPNPKLMTCGRTCGRDYEFTGMAGKKNSQIFTNKRLSCKTV